jgi:hypothetical protein
VIAIVMAHPRGQAAARPGRPPGNSNRQTRISPGKDLTCDDR